MHNAITRAQNAFGFMTTCAFTLAGLIALLSILPYPSPSTSPTASLTVRDVSVVKGRPHYYSPKREEYAQIKFDLDADLSPLFTWNTKQVFVYVTAVYPPTAGGVDERDGSLLPEGYQNQAVIWDVIIPATGTPWSWANLKNAYFPDKKQKRAAAAKSKSKNKNKKDSSLSSSSKELQVPGKLRLRNQKPKYQITDPSGVLSERRNATLEVNWNVQPWVGALVWDKGFLGGRVVGRTAWKARSKAFDFPPLKGSRSAEAVKERQEAKKTEEATTPPVEGEALPVGEY